MPVDFPEGEWTRVLLTFTADAGLYNDVPDKCGSNNPGWNPGGDPWDRTASVYLVEDDCVDTGATCFGRLGNVELLRTITPFGTDDKRPPEGRGSGVVPARTWTFDITPLVPLLEGRKYIGVFIGVFVSAGWDTYVRFDFSERADEASPEPPADGVAKVFFHDGGNLAQSFPVTIPASATQVKARVFTTGHGGNQFCDGGSRNGLSCAGGCPGGSCQNCDEFCHRENQILINDVVRWSQVPWRDDCSPGSIFACQSWNACGWPSCTFSRAGWCPGYIACHKSGTCDQDIDFTQWLTPGATHQLRYNIPVLNGSWTKSVIVYWYE
ncbi:MAG: hypothetical protein HC882_06535 [Acidobacteria bacterium]|nr:hypothetical protein [Acidobacteriota bacterium]